MLQGSGSVHVLCCMQGLAEKKLVEANLEKVDKLRPIAKELGCSLAQLALAWCAHNPHVSSVITGASKPEQVRQPTLLPEFYLSKTGRDCQVQVCFTLYRVTCRFCRVTQKYIAICIGQMPPPCSQSILYEWHIECHRTIC